MNPKTILVGLVVFFTFCGVSGAVPCPIHQVRLRYVSATTLAADLPPVFSGLLKGEMRLQPDPSTNSLLVMACEESDFEQVQKVLMALDISHMKITVDAWLIQTNGQPQPGLEIQAFQRLNLEENCSEEILPSHLPFELQIQVAVMPGDPHLLRVVLKQSER